METQFEKMRQKIETMTNRLHEILAKDHLNESEISDLEKEFEIQALKNEETRQMKAQITDDQEETRQKVA